MTLDFEGPLAPGQAPWDKGLEPGVRLDNAPSRLDRIPSSRISDAVSPLTRQLRLGRVESGAWQSRAASPRDSEPRLLPR